MISRLKMQLIERTQVFSQISPSDLVFDPTWPIFKLVWDFIKTNIPIKFHDHRTEKVTSTEISSRQTFWPSFKIIGLKMWPLERTQGFSKIWPSDLVFDPTWPFSNLSEISSRQTFWLIFMIIGLKMWPLERTQGKKLKSHDGHSTITIAHSEHFVLRWAKKMTK